MDQTDHPCEQCARTNARLIFDQWSKLLLCETCLERMRWQQTWSLLREAETRVRASSVIPGHE
jgi:hypothetical protein